MRLSFPLGLRQLPVPLLAVPGLLAVLGIARAFPAGSPFGQYIGLGAATALVLVPGYLISLAVGWRGVAPTVGWTFAALALALAITFTVHGSLTLALVLYAVMGLAALPWVSRAGAAEGFDKTLIVLGVGILFGIALWHVAGVNTGDSFVHIGRIRRLDDFGSLSLHSMDEFRNGSLSTGYAFPLWQGFLAFVSRLTGLDPSVVFLHDASFMAPLTLAVTYEAGVALFRSAAAGAAVAAATIGLALPVGNGSAPFTVLDAANALSRAMLFPALLVAFFTFIRKPGWGLGATVAACSIGLAFVHVTYGLFAVMLLVAFAAVRAAFARTEVRPMLLGLAAAAVPLGGVILWLLPVIQSTVSFEPSHAEQLRGLQHYATSLDISSLHRYHVKAGQFVRDGPVTIGALALLPLAFFAARRRWAAFALAASVLVLGIQLTSFLFPHFSDIVSLSQSRRLTLFVPYAFVLAGAAAVLARAIGRWSLVLAIEAGIGLDLAFPVVAHGDASSGPGIVAWFALAVGLLALILAFRFAPRESFELSGVISLAAVALFVAPIVVGAAAHWNPVNTSDLGSLTPGLVKALRTDVPPGTVVFASPLTSYHIFAAAPVYIANGPESHIANTKQNKPCAREREEYIFEATGNLAIPEAYGARWLVLDAGELPRLRSRLSAVYVDRRFALYKLPPPPVFPPSLPPVSAACE